MCPLLWWHGSLRRSAVSLPVTICASIFLFSACGDTASVRLTASKKQRVPIIRGNAALPGDYPSTGAVLIGALSARSTGLCSGTLIAPAVVLTAAHCVVGVQPSQLYFSLADDVSQHNGRPGVHAGGCPSSGLGGSSSSLHQHHRAFRTPQRHSTAVSAPAHRLYSASVMACPRGGRATSQCRRRRHGGLRPALSVRLG